MRTLLQNLPKSGPAFSNILRKMRFYILDLRKEGESENIVGKKSQELSEMWARSLVSDVCSSIVCFVSKTMTYLHMYIVHGPKNKTASLEFGHSFIKY